MLQSRNIVEFAKKFLKIKYKNILKVALISGHTVYMQVPWPRIRRRRRPHVHPGQLHRGLHVRHRVLRVAARRAFSGEYLAMFASSSHDRVYPYRRWTGSTGSWPRRQTALKGQTTSG